jgi:hypothetical protein
MGLCFCSISDQGFRTTGKHFQYPAVQEWEGVAAWLGLTMVIVPHGDEAKLVHLKSNERNSG